MRAAPATSVLRGAPMVLRRAPMVLLCAAGGLTVLAGCSAKGGGFERDVVVRFHLPAGEFTPPSASVAAIQQNCPGDPYAKMEPVPGPTALPSVRLNGIRFDVRGANDAQIADLQTCLDRQPDVQSADLEDEDS